MRVRRAFQFEAAHRLPHHPGKCRELHGHSYRLVVTIVGKIDPGSGMVVDFSDLKQLVKSEVVDTLDHKSVNDVMENPTAEEMAVWIWGRLAARLPGLDEVELHETRDCSVVYRGE